MKVLSVKNNKTECVFEIELESKKWNELKTKARKNIGKNIQIPGFRKGHAPQAEIDKRVSDSEVAYSAIQSYQKTFIKDLMETKEFKDSDCIDSISNINVSKIFPVPTLSVAFEAIPKIEGFTKDDVKNIIVPPYTAPKVSDELVKNQIKMMIKPDALVSTKKDGVVAKGDIAVIDFKGFIDDKPFNGGEGKNYELEIGSKSFIDNFEDQLVGCKKGDKKVVNVTFPKDYSAKDFAGKKAKFEVSVKDVRQIEYPEITKNYCSKFGMDCSNMNELEKHIKDLFIKEAEIKYQDEAIKFINDSISKKVKLSYYPKSLVEMHKKQLLSVYEQEAKRSGFKTLEKYKQFLKIDNDKFNEMLEQTARSTLNVSLAYEKLIDDYKITATDDDIKEYVNNLAKYLGDAQKAKELHEKNKDIAITNILKQKLTKKLVSEALQSRLMNEKPKKTEDKAKQDSTKTKIENKK